MALELPPGVSMQVPDLSRFGPQEQKPLLAVTVNPGDRVLILLSQRATAEEVHNLAGALKQWFPQGEFLVLSGPESITVIPRTSVEPCYNCGMGYSCTEHDPRPSEEDKAPQGRMTDAELIAYAKQKAKEVSGPEVGFRGPAYDEPI